MLMAGMTGGVETEIMGLLPFLICTGLGLSYRGCSPLPFLPFFPFCQPRRAIVAACYISLLKSPWRVPARASLISLT